KVTLPMSSQSNNVLAYVMGRYVAGSTPTYYRIGVGQNPSVASVFIRAQRSDSTNIAADASTGIAAAAGVTVWLRIQLEGKSPTILRARAWADGGAEPASWTLTATDSNPAEQVAAAVGIRARNED